MSRITDTDIDNFRDEASRQLRQHFEDMRENLIATANAHIDADGDETTFSASFVTKFNLGESKQTSKFSFPAPKIVNDIEGHLHLEDDEQPELEFKDKDEPEIVEPEAQDAEPPTPEGE